MNYQNIFVFMAVVEHGNFSAAAKALNYTPPGVTEAVKQLEKELGIQLLIRKKGSRNVLVTPAGRAFLLKAKKLLMLDQEIKEFVQEQKERKKLRIAAGTIAQSYIVPYIAQRLIQERLDVKLHLYAMTTNEIAEGLKNKELLFDVAFYYGEVFDESQVTQIPFYEEERVILCPADSVLPDRPLRLTELPSDHRIVYNHRPNTYRRDYAEWLNENWMRPVGNTPPKVRVSNALAIAGYLTEPEDWAFVPINNAKIAMGIRPDRLSIRTLVPAPPPRQCVLLISKSYADTDILKEFFRCCGAFADGQPHLKNVLPPIEQIF